MSVSDGDILRVVATLLWSDGNVMQNVFNAVVTGGGSPWADADIVLDAVTWLDTMYDNLLTSIADTIDGSQAQVYKYDSVDDDWDEVATGPWLWTPTNADSELPRGVAALINLKTTDPDVSGKKYVGGFTEAGLTDGLWPALILSQLLSFGQDWYDPFVGSDSGASWAPGIWSVVDTVFKLAGSTLIIPTIPAYQRRRKRGVGV